MAFPSYEDLIIVTENTTFKEWSDRSNILFEDMANNVVTIGGVNSGNVHVDGVVSANTFMIDELSFSSNNVVFSVDTIFNSNVHVENDTLFSSNGNLEFVGSTNHLYVNNANTTIISDSILIQSPNTTFTGAIHFDGVVSIQDLEVTGNISAGTFEYSGNTLFENLEVTGEVIFNDNLTANFGKFSSIEVENLQATQTLIIPYGDTSERPSQSEGIVFLNNDTSSIEFSDGIEWFSAGRLNVDDDNISNEERYIPMIDPSADFVNQVYTSSEKIFFNPSDGVLHSVEFNAFSDASMKDDIKNIENPTDMLNSFTGKSFQWKHNHSNSYGLIAQEVEENFPELVKTNSKGTKSVSYIPLISILIESVKELQEKVKRLENNDK